MKKIAICLALAFAGLAHADELADADALFQKQAYPQALQLYTRLANAGNAEAQLHLGEMYWYGEAGAIDLVKADLWFRKAAAKGNKSAAAALDVMKQRALRRAELDYWISTYDGADLKGGQFRCPAPRFPAVSKIKEEITGVTASMTAWQECYNGFVRNLNAHSTLATRVPEDISKLFNQQEMAAAKAHLDGVVERIAADASINAKLVLADFAVWRSATEQYVSEHNAVIRSTSSARDGELEARKNNYAPAK
jgi:hypothetical protein